MKLTLTNFKCYTEKVFQFNDNITTLIHGTSGVGKSTILDAIYFVLTGDGSKIITYGKVNCKVELDTHEMTISRSKRPNKLTVIDKQKQDKFEGIEAQTIINKFYGPDLFYLKQDVRNSFILMTPLEKLSFLEKLLFNDIDIGQMKQECKILIKTREHALSESQIKVNLLKGIINEQYLKNNEPKKPTLSSDEIDLLLHEGNEKYTKNLDELSRIQSRITDYKSLKVLLTNKENMLNDISLKLGKINQNNDQLSLSDLSRKKARYRKMKETIDKMEKIQDLEKLIDAEQRYLEIETIKKKKEIEQTLQSESMKDLENKITHLTEYMENMELYFQLRKNDDELFECPECHSSLKLDSNILVKADKKIIDPRLQEIEKKYKIVNVKSIEKEIVKLRKKVELRDDLNVQLSQESLLPDLVRRTNFTVEQHSFEISKLQKSLEGVKLPSQTLSEIERKMTLISNMENEIMTQKINKGHFEDEKKRIETHIYELNDRLNNFESIEELEKIQTLLQTQISDWTENKISLHKESERISKYNDYIKLNSDLNESIQIEKECENRYNASLLYRNKILEAESIAMENIIDVFNTHLKNYIDVFFDDPIIVTLSASPDEKKVNKYQLQLLINYRGNDCDVHSLSGGELNRLIVASTIALCEIVNSPLIMLDESINNLDINTANNVVNSLVNLNDRTVLLILHQAVTGSFSSTYEVK